MSKVVKKVTKLASKAVQTFDPITDRVLGISAREDAKKQADRQAAQAEQAAAVQAANVAEQARAGALSQQSEADRARILAEQQAANDSAPSNTVEIAPAATSSTKRKKFQAPQVGGTGGGGTSIRL